MPDLQEFHKDYGDQVVVLGINWAEDPQVVRDFLDRYAITYTNVLDRRGKAFVAYRLTGIPTTFFIDEEGVIRGVWVGPLKSEEIAESFAKITKAFRPKGEGAD
jgi:peroxiredoxin